MATAALALAQAARAQEADAGAPLTTEEALPIAPEAQVEAAPPVALEPEPLEPLPEPALLPPAAEPTESFGASAHVHLKTPEERASAASDIAIDPRALRDVPRRNAEDYLTLAPGIVLTNHAGQGHASGIFLRGFDAGEGQDLEVIVDGVPLNEPSNAHLHGYADTQLIIPELIERVRVIEGPFDPRQGDFATAGSAIYALGVQERGLRAQLGYGAFDERRGLLLWAPSGAEPGTFAAVDVRDGDGFGPNRAHQSVRALGRYASEAGPLQYALLGASHALSFDSAGVVRRDACEAAEQSLRECVLDPNQGGAASRHLVSGQLLWRRPQRRAELQLYGMQRALRVRENFTGSLLNDGGDDAIAAGNVGDGLDEGYEATTLGLRSRFALAPRAFGRMQRLELGLTARRDDAQTRLWRLRRSSAIPYATVFDTELGLTHIGAYVRGELSPASFITLLGGLRADALGFSTLALDEDASDRVGPRLPTSARDAWGSALSPRGSIVLHALPYLDWTLSAGMGVRSSDAQALSEGEAAPFARAIAFETGPSSDAQLAQDLRLETRAFAFATRVTEDLAFDAERGRNVPIGATHRYGASGSARLGWARIADTLASVTFSEAHLPPDSASAFELGSGPRLPFVPRFVARLDHAFRVPPVRIAGERFDFGAAFGFSYLGPRPLPLGAESEPFAQLDASLRARVRFLELAFSMENLLDAQNHASELHYASDFGDPADEAPTSMRAVSHVAAASPRTWLLTLTAYFDDAEIVYAEGS